MYSYVVTSQKPTAVQHSIICNFTSPTDINLIIAKGNHLEVHTLDKDILIPVQNVALFGKIASLQFYRPPSSQQDVVFVLTERKHFCILGYDTEKKVFISKATGNAKDRVGRDLERGLSAVIDPDNRVIGMLLYEGLLKVDV